MAIIQFGATARNNNAFAVKNNTGSSLVVSIFRNDPIPANGYRYFTFGVYDAYVRGTNFRSNELYQVNGNNTPYLDDVAELASALKSGKLTAYTATYAASGFTLGTALASASYNDGSVIFS